MSSRRSDLPIFTATCGVYLAMAGLFAVAGLPVLAAAVAAAAGPLAACQVAWTRPGARRRLARSVAAVRVSGRTLVDAYAVLLGLGIAGIAGAAAGMHGPVLSPVLGLDLFAAALATVIAAGTNHPAVTRHPGPVTGVA